MHNINLRGTIILQLSKTKPEYTEYATELLELQKKQKEISRGGRLIKQQKIPEETDRKSSRKSHKEMDRIGGG